MMDDGPGSGAWAQARSGTRAVKAQDSYAVFCGRVENGCEALQRSASQGNDFCVQFIHGEPALLPERVLPPTVGAPQSVAEIRPNQAGQRVGVE